MSVEELLAAVNAGAQLCSELIHDGSDLIALGDLGIGNTTASACLVAAFSGAAVDEVVGRGAGVTDGVMSVKQRVVSEALSFHDAVELAKNDPAAALAACGGLEHAALVGVMLAAAARSVPVVLDGVISVASALAACRMASDVRAVLLAGHESAEPGARVGLAHLGLSPLLRLDLHLGEGTGAVLAIPLIQAAVRAMHDMARLAEVVPAGASERAPAGAAEGVPAED
jgi:nicotinate-nucleotide--dimethylbenzimidazole phosphoribosyltransferase